MKIKTIFIGTPDFALPSLKSLLQDDFFDIVGVITQPDKKVGRKQILTPPPVKELALKNNIPVWQPESIKNYQLPITDLDLIVVAAYAKIIPESILNYPKYGCINVHGSLLPKHRGASCVQAAILNGDKETGITIMKMDKGLDTGPIIYQESVAIEPKDTAGSLYYKLSDLGGKILPETVRKYINGELAAVPQDDANANYVGMLKKEDGKIDWSKDAEFNERFIRAMQPWPGAFSSVDELGMKITEVEHKPVKADKYQQGELFLYENKLAIQCGKDALLISRLQLEGKKECGSDEFLRGYNGYIGKILK
ncbi:MAG: methionyl-tRNA formyltransferase [Patescibacteria group bacterium]